MSLREVPRRKDQEHKRKRKSPWRILWEQLTATMVVVLLIAAALSIVLGDYAETIAFWSIELQKWCQRRYTR